MTECFETQRSMLPPSVLPDISPTRGEITRSTGYASSQMLKICGDKNEAMISPLVGEMSGRTEGGNVENQVWPASRASKP